MKRLIVIILALTAALTVTVNASGLLVYPSADIWGFTSVDGSGRGWRAGASTWNNFYFSSSSLTHRQVSLSAPSTLCSSPSNSMKYMQFSGSYSGTASTYSYDKVEITFNFAPPPEYSCRSWMQFILHIDSFVFGTVTNWELFEVLAPHSSVSGSIPSYGIISSLGNSYYLIKLSSDDLVSFTLKFRHPSEGTYHTGFNVGSFNLSFSDAWVDTYPAPDETEPAPVIGYDYEPPESISPIQTADLSGIEDLLDFDFPQLQLGDYMSAFAWWSPVIDLVYSSVPIFSIALSFGIIIGALRILGGLRFAPPEPKEEVHVMTLQEQRRAAQASYHSRV